MNHSNPNRKPTKEQKRYLKERCVAHAESLTPDWNQDIEEPSAELTAARAAVKQWDERQRELRQAILFKIRGELRDVLEALMFESAETARAAADDFCATSKFHYQSRIPKP